MKIRYDKDADAIYIKFQDSEYEISDEVADGIIIDKNKNNEIIGIEILDVSEKIPNKNLKDINFGVSK